MNQNNSNLNWEMLLLIISLRDINVKLTSQKGRPTIKVQHLIKDLQLYRIYLQAAAIGSWWLRLIILSKSLKFSYVRITGIIHA